MSQPQAVREIIERLNANLRVWYASGNVEAVAEAFTEDCWQMPPRAEPLVGRSALSEFWQQAVQWVSGISRSRQTTLSMLDRSPSSGERTSSSLPRGQRLRAGLYPPGIEGTTSSVDRRLALLVSAILAVLPTLARAQQPPAASSFVTREAREAFLATARFATDPPIDGRLSWRAVLDDGTRKHDASVVTEDGSGPTRRNYRFNVAAYELDKLLGLNLVPPTVERTVNGRPASVIWWLDDFAMSEVDRRRKRIDPPDRDGWDRQMHAVRVFDELISNTYRDTAPPLYLNSVWDNLLITTDWTIWLTDHTGAFRTRDVLQDPDTLVRCPRSLLARLRELNRSRLQQTLEKYLSSQQLDALEIRRALLVKHFDDQIKSHGEGHVLYDLPPRPPDRPEFARVGHGSAAGVGPTPPDHEGRHR